MNEQEKLLIPEESTKRKRKILTDPDRIFAKCQVCQEPGNLDNMIRHGIPIKNLAGVVVNSASEYVYFCGENCQGLFR